MQAHPPEVEPIPSVYSVIGPHDMKAKEFISIGVQVDPEVCPLEQLLYQSWVNPGVDNLELDKILLQLLIIFSPHMKGTLVKKKSKNFNGLHHE